MNKVFTQIQKVLPTSKLDIFGSNSLMDSTLPYYILTTVSVAAVFSGIQYCYFYIWITYGCLPFFDEFLSLDERNPNSLEAKKLQKNDLFFKLPLYVTLIIDWILFFRVMNILTITQINMQNAYYLVGFLFIGLNLLATQFSITHEMFHKSGINKYLGTLHMIKNLYCHFTYEHLYGHHRKVGTPEDAASAKKNQKIYGFVLKSYLGSYKSVYLMEKQQKKPIYLNYAVLSVVISLLFISFIFRVYGFIGTIAYLIMAFGSIVFLQSINYVEHYGLRRKKNENGEYEKVTVMHSWNSPHRFSNYFLFKVQRHSDHHQNSSKPYQTLVSMDKSPFLPHGYTVCIFMCFFSSTWFRIMNPLVDAYTQLKKEETIDEEVQKTARKEVRKFIIKIFTTTSAFYIVQKVLFS